MSKVRGALIGCGGIARGHIAAYKAMKDLCELVSCVDIDAEKARAFAQEGGCKWATDFKAVLDEVDAVDICTPPHLHAPMAIAAAAKGKHVLTEKVMATRLEDADEMIRVAEANNVKLMVAYVTRFDPAWRALHEAIQSGAAGGVYLVQGRTAHAPRLAEWRASWETFPMGSLLSHGCHYVDQMIWNFGDIAAASSMGTNSVRGAGLAREDTAVAIFRFKSGIIGSYACSWAAEHVDVGNEMCVYGTEGFLQLQFLRDGVRRVRRIVGREEEVLFEHDPRRATEGPKNFVGECEHFIDCIVNDKEPLTNGRESRKSMEAILAAYQGDDENKIIWIEPGVPYAARPESLATPRREPRRAPA